MIRSVVGAGGVAAAASLAAAPAASAATAAGTLPAGWYDVTDYEATGNGSTDDTKAVNNAIAAALAAGGGVVYFPPGTYLVSAPLTTPGDSVGLRLTGATWSASKIVSTTSSILSLQPGNLITEMEVDHLTLDATNAHLISGADLKMFHLHDCLLIQNSADYAIWYAPSTPLVLECTFERNLEYVYGATRTVPAWYLSTPEKYGAINANVWRDNVCKNWDADATQYWYQVIATYAGANNEGNSFDNLTFELATGGMIDLQSVSRTRIQACLAWDSTTTTENSLINIRSSAAGGPSADTLIVGGLRAALSETLASGAYDVNVAANASHTTIIAPPEGTRINFNGSKSASVIGAPAGLVLAGAAATAAAGSGAGTSAPAPVATAGTDNRSGLVTFGTGSSPSAGWQVQVTFGTPFLAAPTVMITPANGPTAGLMCAVESVTATGFVLSTGSAPSAGQGATHYGFYWLATD